jgi:hypothetical protein
MPDSLTLDQARRIALAAQGLAAVRPAALRAVLDRLGAIQIDSINVVARSHELVLAARAGPHDPAAFERLVYRRRAGFEYWAHAASFVPIGHYRLFLPRMRRLAAGARGWTASAPRGRWPPPPSATRRRAGAAPGGTGRRSRSSWRTCSTRARSWSTTGSTSSAATTWPSGSCPPGWTPPSRRRPRPRWR